MVFFETTFPDKRYFNLSIEYGSNIPKMQFSTSIPKKLSLNFITIMQSVEFQSSSVE